eukprot:scaffold38528_cov66-Phaeocystis_antarctica.AAC.1
MSSTTQPKSFPVASLASIGLPDVSTRNGPRCTCAALAPTSFVNWAVFATSSSMDSASSSLVTVGSSRLPSRPYESVLRTSEPEKPPCSLVTTTREQPSKACSSSLNCGADADKLAIAMRRAGGCDGVQGGAQGLLVLAREPQPTRRAARLPPSPPPLSPPPPSPPPPSPPSPPSSPLSPPQPSLPQPSLPQLYPPPLPQPSLPQLYPPPPSAPP